MAFCGKCGTKVEEGVKFCPGCGNAMVAAAPVQEQPAANQNDFSAKVAAINNTADTTADYDANDIAQNKAMGILAYIGPLCFVPMFAAKGSKFARFHANQGLTLLIACAAWSIIYSILNWILLAISWRLYVVSSIIGLLSLVFVGLCVIGIINAAKGRAKELPLIGKFKFLK